jgi:hypothetical protein
VLPFTKRSPPSDSFSEVVGTDEIEVVPLKSRQLLVTRPHLVESHRMSSQSAPVSSRRHITIRPPADRPRVFEDSVSDEEMTRLMSYQPQSLSARDMTFSAPRKSINWAMAPASALRPAPLTDDDPTLHKMPSSSPPPPLSNMRPATHLGNTLQSVRAVPASERTPPSTVRGAPPSVRPVEVPVAKVASHDSVPGTVITTRTRVPMGRPTATWAAALITMGVVVGLGSAIYARGDAHALLASARALVDPGQAPAAVAAQLPSPAPIPVAVNAALGPQPAVLPPSSPASPAPAAVPLPIVPGTTAAEPADKTADVPTMTMTPPRTPPVAYAAPAVLRPSFVAPGGGSGSSSSSSSRHASRAVPTPAPSAPALTLATASEPKEPKAAAAAPATPPPVLKTVRHSKHASSDDSEVESASAADALARAQLEAALR